MTNQQPGQFLYLNFYIDHESLDFVGYEFEGEDIEIEETGGEIQSLFRMDLSKETGEITVYSAYSGDYDVMEEVTEYFDTKKLIADIMIYMVSNDVVNHGETYVKYIQFLDDGCESDEAIRKANWD
ncbi:hypothetical protein OCO53_25680 [Peribacillus frigoritolerans]|uniref:hypothetical protein n=1 Tax=Peribacillus frigoritolerans TaxID=450367 RepID=UPI0021CFAAD6|nr:hypothetical protein [Peribacillus frigoritolerans]MCU6603835.1 hypothetical protein [Peribacillus frigoritolerans]